MEERKVANSTARRSSINNVMEGAINVLAEKLRKYSGIKKLSEIMICDDFFFQMVNYILTKSRRSLNELLIISTFLKTFPHFVNKIQQQNYDEIVSSLSLLLRSERKPQNNLVFKYGDKGTKFYIVLYGKCSVIVPKENTIKMSIMHYIKYLLYLNHIHEDELMIMTVGTNKFKYSIDLYFTNKLIQYLSNSNSEKYINFNTSLLSPKDISKLKLFYAQLQKEPIYDKQNISPKNYIAITSYKQKILFDEDEIECPFDKDLTIYSYIELTDKKQGDIFGEIALQNSIGKRTATLITGEECIFGYLTHEIYKKSIREIEQKIRKTNISFLLKNQLFIGISRGIFENKYFNLFNIETITQGNKIITQGEKNNKVYFIREGDFELSSQLNLKALQQIIKQKLNISLKVNSMKEDSKTNSKYKISLLGKNDIVGLRDCCINDVSFVDVTCLSTSAEVYSIDLGIIDEIAQKINSLSIQIQSYINQRVKIVTRRLLQIFLFKNNHIKITNSSLEQIKQIFSENHKKEYTFENKLKISNTKCNLKLKDNEIFTKTINKTKFSQYTKSNELNSSSYLKTTHSRLQTSIKERKVFSPKPFISKYKRLRIPSCITNSDKFLKRIVGTRYKKRTQSNDMSTFTTSIIGNSVLMTKRDAPIVDFLYYNNNVIKTLPCKTISNDFSLRYSSSRPMSSINSARTIKSSKKRKIIKV